MPSPHDDAATAPNPDPPGNTQPSAHLGNNVADECSILESRYRDAQRTFNAATEDAFAKFLAPFAETFAVLHEVALDELPTSEAVPELDQVDAETREKAFTAVEVLIVVGGTAGVVSAGIVLGVRALPANTNLVSALARSVPRDVTGFWTEGVAYTRAGIPKFAAQGRALWSQTNRNLAKNKNTLLIGGASAAALAAIAWAVKADNADYEAKLAVERRQKVLDVADHQNRLLDDLDRERLLFDSERTEEVTQTLTSLTDLGLNRLPALRALVGTNDDYTTYTPAERLLIAELAGLAETTAAVIASPPLATPPREQDQHEAQDGTLHAAHDVLRRYASIRNPGSDAAPTIAWTAATLNTASQRQQLAYLLEQPAYLERMAVRCANAHQGVREGFYFEWIHELSFNLDAIGKDSQLRANMTERLGRPHDPADIVLQTPGGKISQSIQAKVVESDSKRVGPKNGLIDRKYRGMALLLPEDDIPRTHEFLDRALDRPAANIYTHDYEDARTRITDTISSGDIASDPISTGKLTEITTDADGHLQQLVRDTRLRQAASSAVAAGGTATVMSLATDTATYLINEGHLDGFAWTEAAVAAARTGAASAVSATFGSLLQSAGQTAVANGSTSLFQESLAHGDHGPALTQATIDIAVIAHGLATGRLTPVQAAAATAETITQSAVVWVCSAVARNIIPDPAAAALIGGIVGQYGAQIITQGIRAAILGRDPSNNWDAAYDALLADTAALEYACAAERDELAALGEQYRIGFTEHVLPALERLTTNPAPTPEAAPGADPHYDPEAALADLAAIADHFAGAPMFDTIDAFDAFMADPTTTLILDLGHNQAVHPRPLA